jgi:hypothetical protein
VSKSAQIHLHSPQPLVFAVVSPPIAPKIAGQRLIIAIPQSRVEFLQIALVCLKNWSHEDMKSITLAPALPSSFLCMDKQDGTHGLYELFTYEADNPRECH